MTATVCGLGRVLVVLLCAACSSVARAQFTLQDSGTHADLRGVVNVGNGTAWASGTHGTVLRTEDGGYMWQGCAMPPGAEGLDFRGIQAFDDQTAIVMSSGKGDLSRVYKTTDGCNTWTLVFTNPDADGFFDSIQAGTAEQMVVLGDPVRGAYALFRSRDGGAQWQALPAAGLAADAAKQGAFAASNSSLLVAGAVPMYVATGGAAGAFVYARSGEPAAPGLTASHTSQAAQQQWTRDAVPVGSSGEATAGVFSLARSRRSGTLVAVGGDYARPERSERTAATRFAGQRTWQLAQTPPHGYRSSVAYDAVTKTWITVGPNGTDASTDDGRNWRALKPGYGDDPSADKQWNALSLPYVVGPHGRIGRLRDDVFTTPPNALPSTKSGR